MSDFFVKAWEEDITIPTYKTGEPDNNPLFLEKRVYQGSSGAVYPHTVIDKVYDEKEDKIYKAVFLENQYLKIMILPQLGGRIQMAFDKTNEYHFVYYNHVIKPALVGLAGPWISGGIEFNWPQHHRPSTFDPVDFDIEENADGSKTVWVSEIEQMFHMKGMAGFTLYPHQAFIEVKVRLYNRSSLPQTFLWWANPAVAADETYQSIFPPDVHAVYDHGKRDASLFPIAKGTYYKVDYSPGTDISWYKNIPVPTSYMAVNSVFDFIGGYNHGRKAGILHIADHHISPGKKQWTWGCGEFGKAWDRQLTDDDGPYLELMTGVFTDNQPDFGWIMPNEERSFSQYFMPYKNIGQVKNATIDALINLEIENQTATIKAYLTSEQHNVSIQLWQSEKIVFEDSANLSPTQTYEKRIPLPFEFGLQNLKIVISDRTGRELVKYIPVSQKQVAIPDPAKPIRQPSEIETTEALFLSGMHLEQYRHATYSPVAYYEEALRRDSSDIRNNNALGLWWLRRGQFTKAGACFRNAIFTQLKHNPNPYDGEPLYNLGLALFQQKKYDEAYNYFFKASWNSAWQDTSFFYLAKINTFWKNFGAALEFAEKAVIKNNHGFQVRHLKTILLRKLNRLNQAEIFARETLSIDPFEFGSAFELFLVLKELKKLIEADKWLQQLKRRMRNEPHNFIEIAIDYGKAGLYEEAIALSGLLAPPIQDPLLFYHLAYYYSLNGQADKALSCAMEGFSLPVGHVFTNRIEDIDVLQLVIKLHAKDYKAWYHLGNIWYDKRQYEEAIDAWEKSIKIFDGFPTVHRNLGLAYYNQRGLKQEALAFYEKAFLLDTSDSRLLYELDQLYKRLHYLPEDRVALLNMYPELVNDRDDLFIEFITLHNLTGRHEIADSLLASRNFHPWEGGEGKASGQYILTCIELAKNAMEEERWIDAIERLKMAAIYPYNLGEGKLYGALENDIHYWMGCAYEGLGDRGHAISYWEKAATGIIEPAPAIFYNDQAPDKIFYMGLALQKLGQYEEASSHFNNLIDYGEQHVNDEVKTDYFAVSLPDLMIFDDDSSSRNQIHCHYITGLGKTGEGRVKEAESHFYAVLKMDSSHVGATLHLKSLNLLHNGVTKFNT
jgi:tetratricopeptide (TPR) repeat protein